MATLGNPKASSLFSVLQVAVPEGTGTTPPPHLKEGITWMFFLGAVGSQGAIDDQKINLLGFYLAKLSFERDEEGKSNRRVGDLDVSPHSKPLWLTG